MSVDEISKRIEHVRNSSGAPRRKITKFNVAESSGSVTSTQGAWSEDLKVKDIEVKLVKRSELGL